MSLNPVKIKSGRIRLKEKQKCFFEVMDLLVLKSIVGNYTISFPKISRKSVLFTPYDNIEFKKEKNPKKNFVQIKSADKEVIIAYFLRIYRERWALDS